MRYEPVQACRPASTCTCLYVCEPQLTIVMCLGTFGGCHLGVECGVVWRFLQLQSLSVYMSPHVTAAAFFILSCPRRNQAHTRFYSRRNGWVAGGVTTDAEGRHGISGRDSRAGIHWLVGRRFAYGRALREKSSRKTGSTAANWCRQYSSKWN